MTPLIKKKALGPDNYKETEAEANEREQSRILMHKSLKMIETFWLKPNSRRPRLTLIETQYTNYSANDHSHLTIADLSAALEIAQANSTDPKELNLSEKYPLIHRWLNEILSLP